ncbi:MAG: DUF1343 domain-containing protein [Flavobacteriales bacterium]|nr:DUF1343 domain-containing protein [Flavobacteriales bacterium]
MKERHSVKGKGKSSSWLFLVLFLSSLPCLSQSTASRTGDLLLDKLKGQRIAVVAHAASVSDGVFILDQLADQQVVKVMSPEHGFASKASDGEHVSDSKTDKGVPIISLYGSHKKPTAEDLRGVDVLLFDLQDLGLRFYTYISTLTYVMEACAENGVKLMVLDRPNPFAYAVDGPMLSNDYQSFIGMHPVPVIYGMTIGEYALMVKGEGWIANAEALNLEVLEIKGYHREPTYPDIAPSPNLPDDHAIAWYPSLCFFEGTTVSVGRGSNQPFTCYGAPWFPMETFSFKPMSCTASKYPKHEGVLCQGVNLREVNPKGLIDLQPMLHAYQQAVSAGVVDDFFLLSGQSLALRYGSDNLRQLLQSGAELSNIYQSWAEDPAYQHYRQVIRPKYLLYQGLGDSFK